ncbi:MAG: 50S ribosomal protein L3 [Clostridiales bacterium]|nr:50S ribosomal protein L3 [Clostridiales bacterium]MBQ3046607.1 50S ribosomal protein L3 [Clostridia bacterium]
MNKAIIGRKLGMTQLFTADGKVVPVTVIEAGPCPVVQVKTLERDGYSAVKLGFSEVDEKLLNKPQAGLFKKAGVPCQKVLKEFKLEGSDAMTVGSVITCDVFAAGDKIDVSGVSKGHGFTGVIKRWNHHRLKETHGVGPVHREVGSMGAISNPSRVFKGKKMSGQWGNENVTILNLEVVKVDKERNAILVKGAVPGPVKGIVTLRNSVKA